MAEKRCATWMDDAVMFVQDASDYFACLVTKAEFGCVLHEEKELTP
jgi:hypothetical protein